MLLRSIIIMMGGAGGGAGAFLWNPSDKTTNIVLSNGNRTAAADTNNYESVRTAKNDFNTVNGGKYYWEVLIDTSTATDIWLGLIQSSATPTSGSFPFQFTNFVAWRNNGSFIVNGGWTDNGGAVSYTATDVTQCALDVPAGKLFLGKNNTWLNGGDPVAGTNAPITGMPSSQDYAFIFSTDNTAGDDQVTIVAPGSHSFSTPSGYTAI